MICLPSVTYEVIIKIMIVGVTSNKYFDLYCLMI